MEHRAHSPKLPDHPAFIPPPDARVVLHVFGGLLMTAIILVSCFGMYAWQHAKLTHLQATTRSLQTQAQNLQRQISANKDLKQ
ncbi:MAG TPA: hypothetical protein VLG11_01140 [Candidatus Saccharimonadales bacterium]|nr:hypothetical protein [Candidatus Saccharimonadales bacterium]